VNQLASLLGLWQLAAGHPGSSLPAPSQVWTTSHDLITDPFYDRGGLDPIFQVLRTVPPLAWLPLSLAAFRDAQPSAIFVIFITAVWPVIINTAVGVRNVPQDYRNAARVVRLRGFGYFAKIILPSAASWLAIVAAEMLIGGVGIGFFIWDAWNSSDISDIIVALIYVGLVGFVLDRIVALAGRLVTRGTSA